jgi:hypothetical protein
MTDPDNFLSRWSRRKAEKKRDAEREQSREAAPAPQSSAKDAASDAPAPQQTSPESAKPAAFDPASLPSIESIAADTDISAFLQPGVPTHVRNAALRRAWSVDPAISTFKGLQENDWDFNDPNGIAGLGPLSPTLDVKKMVAALFGETEQETPPPAAADHLAEAEKQSDASADKQSSTPAAGVAANADSQHDAFVQRDIDAATQHADADRNAKPRRRSGGALPDC